MPEDRFMKLKEKTERSIAEFAERGESVNYMMWHVVARISYEPVITGNQVQELFDLIPI